MTCLSLSFFKGEEIIPPPGEGEAFVYIYIYIYIYIYFFFFFYIACMETNVPKLVFYSFSKLKKKPLHLPVKVRQLLTFFLYCTACKVINISHSFYVRRLRGYYLFP